MQVTNASDSVFLEENLVSVVNDRRERRESCHGRIDGK